MIRKLYSNFLTWREKRRAKAELIRLANALGFPMVKRGYIAALKTSIGWRNYQIWHAANENTLGVLPLAVAEEPSGKFFGCYRLVRTYRRPEVGDDLAHYASGNDGEFVLKRIEFIRKETYEKDR